MFQGGAGGGGGGAEPPYSSRGVAHPYMDSVLSRSRPSGLAAYPGRPVLASGVEGGGSGGAAEVRAASADSLQAESESFTTEDRMLLRLLYHQQQAIQVQLNTMTEWMQQVNYRIASLERLGRTPRSAAATGAAAAAAPTASPPTAAPPPSRSTSAAATEGHGAMAGPPPHGSSPALSAREAPRPQASGSAPASVYSGQSPHHATTPSVAALGSALEVSRACTPPSEQARHPSGGRAGGGGGGGGGGGAGSAVPSSIRSFESAMAQPWDPHSTSMQSGGGAGTHSRASSYTSALGRRANPLLTSSATLSKLPVSASRPSWGDPRQVSRLDASVPSGTAHTSFSSGFTSFDTLQPQSRQPPVVSPPTTATVPYSTSLSYTSADAIVPPYRRMAPDPSTRNALGRPSTTATRAPLATSGTSDAAPARSEREGTLPPANGGSVTATGDYGASAAAAAATTAATAATADVARTLHGRTGASYRDPGAAADPSGAVGTTARSHDVVARSSPAANDDSLSDGYGSYESRMYMKNLGLL
ncbi:hypothetical protein NESM_000611900 [Novymonas esmeraldas]|uniref:Uncharacterized protein n=1 Tax=Novymonas esmeraldas TaxID=1808958 RepID=A0AAW0EU98_9TRYP